jgi:hypothetical protein
MFAADDDNDDEEDDDDADQADARRMFMNSLGRRDPGMGMPFGRGHGGTPFDLSMLSALLNMRRSTEDDDLQKALAESLREHEKQVEGKKKPVFFLDKKSRKESS